MAVVMPKCVNLAFFQMASRGGGDSSGCMHAYEKMAINFLSDWFMGSIATLEFSSITA